MSPDSIEKYHRQLRVTSAFELAPACLFPKTIQCKLDDELEDEMTYQPLSPDQPLPTVEEDAAVMEQIAVESTPF